MRYASNTFSDADWNASWVNQVTNEPAPQQPGNTQQLSVMGLEIGTTYYFRIKSVDDAGNISDIRDPQQNKRPIESKAGSI